MWARLKAGEVYYGGLDKPVLASWQDIREALAENGLQLVSHWVRGKPKLAFDPRADPNYSDNWDHVAVVTVKRSQLVELPDRVRWFFQVPEAAPPTPVSSHDAEVGRQSGEAASLAAATSRAARTSTKHTSAGPLVLGALAAGALVWMLARSRSRG